MVDFNKPVFAAITALGQMEYVTPEEIADAIIDTIAAATPWSAIIPGIGSLIGSKGAGGVSYQLFIFPGILAMSIITSSLFSAMSIVWDREFGFLREMLVAPVTRGSLVLGKAVGGGTVSVAQGLLLIVFAPFIGVSLNPVRVFGLVNNLFNRTYYPHGTYFDPQAVQNAISTVLTDRRTLTPGQPLAVYAGIRIQL